MTTDTRDVTAVLSDTGLCIGFRTTERPPRFIGQPITLFQTTEPGPTLTGNVYPETITPEIIIPAGTMTPGSSVRVTALLSSAGLFDKTVNIMLGTVGLAGGGFLMPAGAQSAALRRDGWVRSGEGSMRTLYFPSTTADTGNSTSPIVATGWPWDTTDTAVYIMGDLSNAADTLRVEAWRIELFPAE